jgi:hypothetical protein
MDKRCAGAIVPGLEERRGPISSAPSDAAANVAKVKKHNLMLLHRMQKV